MRLITFDDSIVISWLNATCKEKKKQKKNIEGLRLKIIEPVLFYIKNLISSCLLIIIIIVVVVVIFTFKII